MLAPTTDFPTFAAQTAMDAEVAAAAAKDKEQRIQSLMKLAKQQRDEKHEAERRLLRWEAESKRQALAQEAEYALELKEATRRVVAAAHAADAKANDQGDKTFAGDGHDGYSIVDRLFGGMDSKHDDLDLTLGLARSQSGNIAEAAAVAAATAKDTVQGMPHNRSPSLFCEFSPPCLPSSSPS